MVITVKPVVHLVESISEKLEIILKNEPTDLVNEDYLFFIIPSCVKIPTGVDCSASIRINGESIEVRDKFGNPMQGEDLETCTVHCSFYGTEETKHLQVINKPSNR